MTEDVKLTWAIKVDSATLGARLEAFLETREVEALLSICAKKPGAPFPLDFPLKIIKLIASAVGDMRYKSKIKGWQRAVQCIRGDCWSLPKEWHDEN